MFDVPKDNYLHGCYSATNPYMVPADEKVEVYRGVFPGTKIPSSYERMAGDDTDVEDYGFQRMFGKDTASSSDVATPEKTKDEQGSLRDLRIKELEQELTRVKAKLSSRQLSQHVTMDDKFKTAGKSTWGMGEEAPAKQKCRPKPLVSEKSQSEYDTCRESDWPQENSRRFGKPRRYKHTVRRSGSESDESRTSVSADMLADVVRKCLSGCDQSRSGAACLSTHRSWP